jgi:hypothetical protein
MHNGELHDMYSSPNIIEVIKTRRTRWVEYVWGNLDERDDLHDIKMDVTETVWKGMDCSRPAQNRDKWQAVVNLQVPSMQRTFRPAE